MKKKITLQYGKFLALHANKSRVLCNSMVSAEKGLGEEREHGDKDCAQHQIDSQYSREGVGGREGAWVQEGLRSSPNRQSVQQGKDWGKRRSMGKRRIALSIKQTVSAAGKGLEEE